jgi:hypothetical protein
LGQISCIIPTGAKGGARRSQVGPGISGGNGLRMVTYKKKFLGMLFGLGIGSFKEGR